jgi:ABC-type amino acid transport substrate-binding protein
VDNTNVLKFFFPSKCDDKEEENQKKFNRIIDKTKPNGRKKKIELYQKKKKKAKPKNSYKKKEFADG